ncbi:hypothetical protein V8C26DRAFT_386788 [Trichoderma gracile]
MRQRTRGTGKLSPQTRRQDKPYLACYLLPDLFARWIFSFSLFFFLLMHKAQVGHEKRRVEVRGGQVMMLHVLVHWCMYVCRYALTPLPCPFFFFYAYTCGRFQHPEQIRCRDLPSHFVFLFFFFLSTRAAKRLCSQPERRKNTVPKTRRESG